MENPEFVTEMIQMNDQIREMKNIYLVESDRQEELEYQIKLLEARTMDEVTSAVGADGKTLFTNADKRQSEMKMRLSINESYNSNLETLKTLRRKLQTLNIDIDHLQRKFSIFKIIGALHSNN